MVFSGRGGGPSTPTSPVVLDPDPPTTSTLFDGDGEGGLQGDWGGHLWPDDADGVAPTPFFSDSNSGGGGDGGGDHHLTEEDFIAQFMQFIKHEKKKSEGGCGSSDRYSRTVREQLLSAMGGGASSASSAIMYDALDEKAKHYGIYIDCHTLLDGDMLLGHMLLRNPKEFLGLFAKAMQKVQDRLKREHTQQPLVVKPNVHPRIMWLPRANRKANISSIRSSDAGALLQFSGTVTRCGQLKVLEAIRYFQCNNEKCSATFPVHAAVNQAGGIIEAPTGPCTYCRKSSTYTDVEEDTVCYDYQEIKVQEQVQKLGMGSIPRSIVVMLQHDLVDTVKPGDDVVVTGMPMHRWGGIYKEERCNLETVIDANSLHVMNSSKLQFGGAATEEEIRAEFQRFWDTWGYSSGEDLRYTARNIIISSVCPQLYGLFVVKLAVLLTLIGCPAHVDERSKTRTRGQSHLLLVGDPGTGKSQFLRFAAEITPRSVLTTGVGTTSAGLTCSTVRDGGDFMLEAGALVLADRGLCCIDEFGSMRKHDRGTIHEAMEQQTLSVAKAGLVCKLNTRATVLAAMNPKGKYDTNTDLSVNTNIASPLLSRFDIVLVLLDEPDPEWDLKVSEFLLKKQMFGSTTGGGSAVTPTVNGHRVWSKEKLQAYIQFIKTRMSHRLPLTSAAHEVIKTYYRRQRGGNGSDTARTTVRLLESLLRIAQAHARLMWGTEVQRDDALVAVSIIEMSMNTGFALSENAVAHIDFPDDPEQEFCNMRVRLLMFLGLPHLISDEERAACNDDAAAMECGADGAARSNENGRTPPRTTISEYFSRPAKKTRRDGFDDYHQQ